VLTEAEGEMSLDRPVDVEAGRFLELARIALGSARQQEHAHVFGNRVAVKVDGPSGPATLHLRRWIETQELLDRGP
jgi:hypothetical protein